MNGIVSRLRKKKKIKDLTERELKDICNKNCKNCRECPLVISQSYYHIHCMLTPELVRTQEKEIEVSKMSESLEVLENWYNTENPNTKAYEYEQHYKIIKKDLNKLEKLKSIIEDKYNEIEKKLNARVDYDYQLHLTQRQFLKELKEIFKDE